MTNQDTLTLAQTIFGEARGEYKHASGGLAALIAVANVIVNRSKKPNRFGSSIHHVCTRAWQFSCWNENDPNRALISSKTPGSSDLFDLCYEVAENVISGKWPDLTKGSDHYHAPMATLPAWAHGASPQVTIGHHKFYKLG